jgi:hypothetical protein
MHDIADNNDDDYDNDNDNDSLSSYYIALFYV